MPSDTLDPFRHIFGMVIGLLAFNSELSLHIRLRAFLTTSLPYPGLTILGNQ